MFFSSEVKIGISPLTWTNDDMPELGGNIPFTRCIKEMSKAGFLGCEVGNKFPKNPKELNAKLKEQNLEISAGWFSSFFADKNKKQETIGNFIKHVNFLKSVGAKIINVCECSYATHKNSTNIFANKPVLTDEEFRAVAKGLNFIGEIARKNDMYVAFHPHMGTVIQNEKEIDKLMSLTDHKKVFLLLDTGHAFFAGDNPYYLTKKYGPRIKHVHLKDVRLNILQKVKQEKLSFLEAVKLGVFTTPGDGGIYFKPIFKALKNANYQGWFLVEAEQDPKKAPPLLYAQKARYFIQKTTGL
ncbi:myo-inosose-2 dehydratase [Sulfobacillus acidophilus]|uniref:Myo-inosose-2 dehydratase n=1 Tax=Sulfobacillus acidophilus TaxID=53633 RepID=A0ABS3AVB1_9FIRM|nr:myo-inosose-2 dehydratase [Sulfobacillus acidophilus]